MYGVDEYGCFVGDCYFVGDYCVVGEDFVVFEGYVVEGYFWFFISDLGVCEI